MKHEYQRLLFIEIHGRWFYWWEHQEMMSSIEREMQTHIPNYGNSASSHLH
jgi:hypothetical protein